MHEPTTRLGRARYTATTILMASALGSAWLVVSLIGWVRRRPYDA